VADTACLGAPAADAVAAWLERTPSSRVLFVRRPGRARERFLVFAVKAGEREAVARRIELDDLAGLAETDPATAGTPVDGPLVLVCGHGTRDACCALRGNALFAALRPRLPAESLWLSSHQGGHRFAANALVLPAGIQLGRLAPDGAAGVVEDALSGVIALDHYRGRTAYTAREQAAEIAVRRARALERIDDLRLLGDDGSVVRFLDPEGREHGAAPEEISGPAVPASCGTEPEPQRHFAAQLV
jgi:hypothetical protein